MLACPEAVTQSASSHLCKTWAARDLFTRTETALRAHWPPATISPVVHVGCEPRSPGLRAGGLAGVGEPPTALYPP